MCWIIFSLIVALDQISKLYIRAKFLIEGTSVQVFRFINITYIENSGAAFGIFSGAKYLLIFITLLFLFITLYYRFKHKDRINRLTDISLGLIFGGTIGNLIDRIISGTVTDFIQIGIWPVFNIADIAICVGIAVLILCLYLYPDGIGGENFKSKI